MIYLGSCVLGIIKGSIDRRLVSSLFLLAEETILHDDPHWFGVCLIHKSAEVHVGQLAEIQEGAVLLHFPSSPVLVVIVRVLVLVSLKTLLRTPRG